MDTNQAYPDLMVVLQRRVARLQVYPNRISIVPLLVLGGIVILLLTLVLPTLKQVAIWRKPISAILLGTLVVSFHFWFKLYLSWQSYQRILREERHGIWDLMRLTNRPIRHILQTRCYRYLHQGRYLLSCEVGLHIGLALTVRFVLNSDIVISNDWWHIGFVTLIAPALALLDISLGLVLSMALTLIIRSTTFVGLLLMGLHLIMWSGGLCLSWLILLSHEFSIALFVLGGLGVASYLILLWIGLVGIWMIDGAY